VWTGFAIIPHTPVDEVLLLVFEVVKKAERIFKE